MPEGPSVLQTAHKLHGVLTGSRLISVAVVGGRYERHGPPEGLVLLQRQIRLSGDQRPYVEGVGCKGKLMWWNISGGLRLVSTLGLFGSGTFRKGKHSAVEIVTTRCTVWFTDQLHYGTVSIIDAAALKNRLKKIGPDVLRSPPPSYDRVRCMFENNANWTLPKLLMNQSKVSGIGNYLKAEILYAAGISPARLISELTEQETRCVYLCMVIVPRLDLLKRGLCVERIVFPWQFAMQVYKQKRDPQGNRVERLKTDDKRVTHWVPATQM